MKTRKFNRGFTLIELLVTIAIIGIIMAIVNFSFQNSRMNTRDKVRQTTLNDIQLALETYRAQTGSYPLPSCGGVTYPGQWTSNTVITAFPVAATCPVFISSLVPSYLPSLPNPNPPEGRGFAYRSDGNDYKLIVYEQVEANQNRITAFSDRFSPCPQSPPSSPSHLCESVSPSGAPARSRTYAVYSPGAAQW
jgi:type IV pilus assembly protein PilE